MYNEFPTVYETSLELKWVYFIILGIIFLIILVISLISLARIFKKANRSGISAFIPFYNLIILLEITNSSKWYFIFLLIPGINLIFYIIIMFSLAKLFRKTIIFGLGMTFLPFIFYPILSFSDSEYMGINLVAMEGKSVTVDIPKIVDTDAEEGPFVHEEKDTSLQNINISIGGGVYQKDYTNTLLQVDEKQVVPNQIDSIIQQDSIPSKELDNSINSFKSSFINPIEQKTEYPKENVSDSIIQFPNPIDSIQNPTDTSIVSNIIETNNTKDNIVTSFTEKSNEKPQNNFRESHYSLEEESGFIFCPKCGAKVKGNAKVCFLCGRKLD